MGPTTWLYCINTLSIAMYHVNNHVCMFSRSVVFNSLLRAMNLLGSTVHGISMARILELPFSITGYLPDLGIEPASSIIMLTYNISAVKKVILS